MTPPIDSIGRAQKIASGTASRGEGLEGRISVQAGVIQRVAGGAAAIIDQGTTAGANFLFSLHLVRIWSIETFGVFATLYAGVTACNYIHNALIAEPLTVFAGRRLRSDLRSYILQMLLLHLLLSLTIVGIATSAGALLPIGVLNAQVGVIYGFGLAGAMTLWFGRRVAFVLGRPRLAVAGAVIYATVLLGGGIGGLHVMAKTVNVVGAFAVVGIAGISGGLLPVLSALRIPGGTRHETIPNTAREAFSYGKWAIAYAPVGWIVSDGPYLLLPILAGFGTAGVFRAVMNVAKILQQIIVAVGTFLLADLSRLVVLGGRSAVLKRGLFDFGALVPVALVIWVVGLFFSSPILNLLYGSSLSAFAPELQVALFMPVVWAVSQAFITILRALGSAREVTFAFVLGGLIPAGLIYPFAATGGAFGSLLGLVTVYSLVSLALGAFAFGLARVRRSRGDG